MKILNKLQTTKADKYTIETQKISSVELMERAASAFTKKFTMLYPASRQVRVFCGLGNNGGDGLAIARMLHHDGYDVLVYIINYASTHSKDYQINLSRAEKQLDVMFIDDYSMLEFNDSVIIDALLGSGLSRKLEGLLKSVVEQINAVDNEVVSVDSPTGLFTETPNHEGDCIIEAAHTVTFQAPKLAFLLPQNDKYAGSWHPVDIGLDLRFLKAEETDYFYLNEEYVSENTISRPKNAHKGTFGSALLVAGSYGMTGAAVLSARACLRSGVGKLTIHSVPSAYQILQTAVPEAMFTPAPDHDSGRIHSFFYARDLQKYHAIGVGPGMGTDANVKQTLNVLIEVCRELQKPLIIDADGLNNIAESPLTISRLPKNTILTPHPGEFKRLVNKSWKNDYERLEILKEFAFKNKIIVCLKGAHTAVATPDGKVYFNTTGNPGMATAGSGDVLTGVILSFLAQGYEPLIAATLGVFEHGLAGDRAVLQRSQRSIIAEDIINYIR